MVVSAYLLLFFSLFSQSTTSKSLSSINLSGFLPMILGEDGYKKNHSSRVQPHFSERQRKGHSIVHEQGVHASSRRAGRKRDPRSPGTLYS